MSECRGRFSKYYALEVVVKRFSLAVSLTIGIVKLKKMKLLHLSLD